VLHADVYAEGGLRVENGTEIKRGIAGLLDLNTRGTLELKSIKSRVAQQVQRDDPLYQRAIVQRTPAAVPPLASQTPQANPSPIQRAGYQQAGPSPPVPQMPPPPDPPPGTAPSAPSRPPGPGVSADPNARPVVPPQLSPPVTD